MTSYQRSLDNYYQQQARGKSYYRAPAFQRGHGLGGIFRALMRVAKPIFHSAAPVLKKGAKAIARDAVRAGAEIANDAISGRDLASSVEERSKEAAQRLITKGTKKLISVLEPPAKRRKKSIKARKSRSRTNRKPKDVFDK